MKEVIQAAGEAFGPQLEREHPTLQNMKFLLFFLLLWAYFALLDLDPADQNQCGSVSTTLVKMGS
jgi:hypothetical protein